ncbi:hypothetical protein FRB99_009009 [Tulasnella sp. 403]|nr:hypothetical protein FRB99_009009 [Tulasnella sp. 403]
MLASSLIPSVLLSFLIIPFLPTPALPLNGTHAFVRRAATVDGVKAKLPQAGGKAQKRTIVAIGDLHGDMVAAITALAMSGTIVPTAPGVDLDVLKFNIEQWRWSGNVDIVIQTGDIVDRGVGSTGVFLLFQWLRSIAGPERVINLFGNHEMWNLMGYWTDVDKSDIDTNGGIDARQKLYTDPSQELGRMFREDFVVAARVPYHDALGPVNTGYDPAGDDVFGLLSHSAVALVHGGLVPGQVHRNYPTQLNSMGKDIVRLLQDRNPQPRPKIKPNDPDPALPELTPEQRELLFGEDSVLWYRGWATEPDEEKVCENVDEMLKAHGVRRLVMAHTIVDKGIISRCNGKVFLIDTGMSYAFKANSGAISALKFEYELEPTKKTGTYWEKEAITAIYPQTSRPLLRTGGPIVYPQV